MWYIKLSNHATTDFVERILMIIINIWLICIFVCPVNEWSEQLHLAAPGLLPFILLPLYWSYLKHLCLHFLSFLHYLYYTWQHLNCKSPINLVGYSAIKWVHMCPRDTNLQAQTLKLVSKQGSIIYIWTKYRVKILHMNKI